MTRGPMYPFQAIHEIVQIRGRNFAVQPTVAVELRRLVAEVDRLQTVYRRLLKLLGAFVLAGLVLGSLAIDARYSSCPPSEGTCSRE